MSAVCPTVSSGAGVVERLAGYVECQSQQIDKAAFVGGLWHGLPAVLVTALTVLYVVGFGYRLILHHRLDAASLVQAAFRLGIVIAVTTTFSAYSALFYTLSFQGPSEVVAMVLAPTGLRAPSLTEASHAAAGYLDALTTPSGTVSTTTQAQQTSAPVPASAPADAAQNSGRAVFLLSCVGFALAARLAQAIVMALGPLFVATALFDLSIGLFVGWLRSFVALFLAQTGYAVSMALELSFFARDLSLPTSDPGGPLLVGVFFLACGVAITVIAVVTASGLVRVDIVRRAGAFVTARTGPEAPVVPQSPWPVPEIRNAPTVSRVQRVTDAVGALSVADEPRQDGSHVAGSGGNSGAAWVDSREPLSSTGPGLRRPGHLRASTGSAKRDLIS